METPLIEFQNVTKRFGTKTVLERVNLKIYEGEVTTIIGPAAEGKVSSSSISSACWNRMKERSLPGQPLREGKRHLAAFSPGEISATCSRTTPFSIP